MEHNVVTKLGVFLDSKPHGGGTYQYSQAILESLSSIGNQSYKVIAKYTDNAWNEELKKYSSIESSRIANLTVGKYIGKILRHMSMGMHTWRKVSAFIDPVAKHILSEKAAAWIFPAQDAWAYQIPVKSIVPIHDLMHRYEQRFPEIGSPGIYKRRESHYKWICQWGEGILVDSEIGKQQVVESYNIPVEKVYILPFIAPRYIYRKQSNNKVCEKYNLPEKFLFYPAQFWAHKNHLNLIDAIAKLSSTIPEICLILAGTKKNGYQAAFEKVQKLNIDKNVRFLGYVSEEDIVALYEKARAMIMATYCGPTNIPPLEAFVMECPVAVSRVYGMPEQVGDAALLFDPNSVDEMAEVCHRLWDDDDLCHRLIINGKKHISAWGPEQFTKRLKNIIKKVIDD